MRAAFDTLEKLKALTSQLPEFPQVTSEQEGFKEFKMDCGSCFSWKLLQVDDISVHRWYNSAGSIFPSHAHAETEWVIVYDGAMELTYQDGRKVTLERGDSAQHEPGQEHEASFSEDTRYITIMIPAASYYPA